MKNLSRRDFTKLGAAGSAALAATPGARAADKPKTDVWIFQGPDNRALMNRCMNTVFANGGFGPGAKKIALKVNAAWDRTPEQAANTHPDLVDVFLERSIASGVQVVIPEHPCHRAAKSFPGSGIQQVADKHGVKMIDLKNNEKAYREMPIPGGKILTSERVATEFLEADAVVNMPIAKHHGGATLTMCMKNWLGAVEGRKLWHAKGLHQCIADFCTFMKPTWAILDATSCMTADGPLGPSEKMIYPQQLILSKDQVAADAVGALLFHETPYAVRYLEIARDMGIGETEISSMNIHRVTV